MALPSIVTARQTLQAQSHSGACISIDIARLKPRIRELSWCLISPSNPCSAICKATKSSSFFTKQALRFLTASTSSPPVYPQLPYKWCETASRLTPPCISFIVSITMSPTTIPYTVTYRCPGTEPPVFLAGNFTALEWGLQEMGYSRQEGGEYVFESRVFVEPGREYHFKFKAGREGPWLLDENRPTGECSSSFSTIYIRPLPLTKHCSSSYRRVRQPQQRVDTAQELRIQD